MNKKLFLSIIAGFVLGLVILWFLGFEVNPFQATAMTKREIGFLVIGAVLAAALASLFFYIVIAWILGYDVNLFQAIVIILLQDNSVTVEQNKTDN